MKSVMTKLSRGLRGEIFPAPDKSISHRALIFSALANGTSQISNLLLGEDVLRTLTILRQLGVKTSRDALSLKQGQTLEVKGVGLDGLSGSDENLYCGNSGTTMRLMLGVLSGRGFKSVLTGDASLDKRPMKRVYEPLQKMGAEFSEEIKEGRRFVEVLPALQLRGTKLELPVASAQVKSAIIMAALRAQGITTISEPSPSRDHTELMLKSQGVSLKKIDSRTFSINPVKELRPLELTIPGDISSAAFFMVAALIVPESDLLIRDFSLNPTRTGLLDVLIAMGGDITILSEREQGGEVVGDVRFRYSSLRNLDVSGALIPRLIDEIPILALAATQATGTMRIKDAAELRVKESDRIHSIRTVLESFGALVKETEDGLMIEGKKKLQPPAGSIDTFGDHRIAMMSVIAGLLIEKPFEILNAESINTSFPSFFSLLEGVGA